MECTHHQPVQQNKENSCYRQFYTNLSSSILLKLYLSHIRPHLEYCSVVWNPHHKGDIAELEKVQTYALKVCMKPWDSSYEDLFATSNIPSLESRRRESSVCHLFKIINRLTDYPSPTINLQKSYSNIRSAGSNNKLTIPKFHTCSYQHSFFRHPLPNGIGYQKKHDNAGNLVSYFKCLLHKHTS